MAGERQGASTDDLDSVALLPKESSRVFDDFAGGLTNRVRKIRYYSTQLATKYTFSPRKAATA